MTLHNSIHALADPTPATMPDVYDLVVGGNRVAVFVSLLQLASTATRLRWHHEAARPPSLLKVYGVLSSKRPSGVP